MNKEEEEKKVSSIYSSDEDLKQLLLDDTPEFTKIANCVMNQYVIVTSKAEYRVCEVEFYFNDDGKHRDTFTHGDPI